MERGIWQQFLGNTYHQGPGRSLYPGRRWHHFYLTRKIHHTGRFQTQEQKKLQGSGKLVHHPQGKKKNTECTIHRLGEVNKTQVKLSWEGEQQERGWWTGTEVKGNNELRLKMATTESWKTENQHTKDMQDSQHASPAMPLLHWWGKTVGTEEVATNPAVTRGSRSTKTFDGMQQHRTVVQLARWCHVIRRKKKGGENHINTCLPCLGETSVWGSAPWDRGFLKMVMSSRQAGGSDI